MQHMSEGNVVARPDGITPIKLRDTGHDWREEYFIPSAYRRSLKASTAGPASTISRCALGESISSAPARRLCYPVARPLTPPPEAERRDDARGRQRAGASGHVKVETPTRPLSRRLHGAAQTEISAVRSPLIITAKPRQPARNKTPIVVQTDSEAEPEPEPVSRKWVKAEPDSDTSSYVSSPPYHSRRIASYIESLSTSPRTSCYETPLSSVTAKPALAGDRSAPGPSRSQQSPARRSPAVKTESISTSSSPDTGVTQTEDEDSKATPLHERKRAEINARRREFLQAEIKDRLTSEQKGKGKATQSDVGYESSASTYQSTARDDDSISARVKATPRRTRTEPSISAPIVRATRRLGRSETMPLLRTSSSHSYKVCSICLQPVVKARVNTEQDGPSCVKCRQPLPTSASAKSTPKIKRVECKEEGLGLRSRSSTQSRQSAADPFSTFGLSAALPSDDGTSVDFGEDPRSPKNKSALLRSK